MSKLVSLTQDGEVGIITVNNPPVNALSPGVPEDIEESIRKCQGDDSIKSIVLIGAGRTFIAGFDIREFGKITSGERERGEGLHPTVFAIEDCSKPVVAAIHGTALGGGLEIAMGCHYRVALASAQIGQPEVKLGIIPGSGGTLRLPRLAGVEKAVEMCAFGEPITAKEALEYGIIDRVLPGERQEELLTGAVTFARGPALAGGASGPRKTRAHDEKLGDDKTNAPIFAAAREAARKKKRGMMAPLKAIDAVEAAAKLSFAEARRKEAELFGECLFSDQSKALIHVFFGEREVRKIPGIPKETPTLDINKAAVAGAGTMGTGIAMVFVNAGIPVILKDVSQQALDRGLKTARANYDRSVKRGRLTPEFVEARMSMIEPVLDYESFKDADLIVEAVFETMDLKKQVFRELDRVAKAGAVLATNTSTLDIDEIASATARPESVVGLHFFSPANIMRLLEIVRGGATAKQVIATSMALARRLRKVGVLVRNCWGFVGNRMFGAYTREAQFLVEEGARPSEVDSVLENFGMAMGPLATGDLAGLDVGWRIRQEHRHSDPQGVRQPLAEDRVYEAGRYGQKTRAGWYRYDENRRRMEDPEVETLVAEAAQRAGIERRAITTEEILDRTVYALINEGAKILEEGYALRAVDIDMIYIYGYGFPAYRGGPMWYADTTSLQKVYERICGLEQGHGYWWKPAPLLKQLSEEGSTFARWDKDRGVSS